MASVTTWFANFVGQTESNVPIATQPKWSKMDAMKRNTTGNATFAECVTALLMT
jgi:hypothetical protein